MDIIDMITESGVAGVVIVILGAFAIGIIIERVKTLYFEYRIDEQEFISKVKGLVLAGNIEEAITYCAANQRAPLAHVVKTVLERADRDDESIQQGLDIAMAEVIPQAGKRLGYLAMVSNVSTLVGLLGTISGLIMSFKAVSIAEPSQKQTLLAQGISLAMNTTAMGLSVAIPVMIAFAFLNARQTALIESVTEHASKIVDLLTTRHYASFDFDSAFPQDLSKEKVEQNVKVDQHKPA